MSDTLLTQLDAGVFSVTFNRPEKKNAFTHAMYEAATAALQEADRRDDIRVVLLSGAGGAFTAGNDIGDFVEHPPAGEDSAVFRYLRALSSMEKPVLAAVEGAAVGIGTTMLLHCDYVVAGEKARFSMPFVNLGLCAEGASSLLLPRMAGFALASELLMFGDPFSAETALRAGIINKAVPEAQLKEVATERARSLAARPMEALKVTKRLIRGPLREQVQETLKREGVEFIQRLHSDEAREALMSFMTRGRK
ncbi:enoyl-CoA hydratase [Corallococcus llansteffanensis]|uniref:Enoyl-CoA hydratase n=1 Tax=Corallococcus llansteffanensis TaxID=2316731 RepID=A0A3A8P3H4_9BACT|nr:enoyl-CoA hydratase [Corallococcus llansteffanensis]RKH49091.1 enoyl-CoA hydratase [Corallococcus llansteffanensis]